MPEWYLLIGALTLISGMGVLWSPLLWTLVLLASALGAVLIQALRSAARIHFCDDSAPRQAALRLLTAFLHLMQPLARLTGRLRLGLSPWRQLGTFSPVFPRLRRSERWSERWHTPEHWLTLLEKGLYAQRTILRQGGDFDRWDLEVRGGLFGAARLLMVIEEHGDGKQLVRLRSWPRLPALTQLLVAVFGSLAAAATVHLAWEVAALMGLVATLALLRGLRDCAVAQATMQRAFEAIDSTPAPRPPQHAAHQNGKRLETVAERRQAALPSAATS